MQLLNEHYLYHKSQQNLSLCLVFLFLLFLFNDSSILLRDNFLKAHISFTFLFLVLIFLLFLFLGWLVFCSFNNRLNRFWFWNRLRLIFLVLLFLLLFRGFIRFLYSSISCGCISSCIKGYISLFKLPLFLIFLLFLLS